MFFIAHLGPDFYAKTLQEKVQHKKFTFIGGQSEEPLKQDFLLQTAAKSFAIPFASLKAELRDCQNNLKDQKYCPTQLKHQHHNLSK